MTQLEEDAKKMKPQRDFDFIPPRNKDEIPFGSGFAAGHLTTVNSGYRTFAPVIDYDKCIHCLMCFVYCPDGAICKDEINLTIDMNSCKVCGICAHECPKKAITMVKEDK